MSTMLLESQHAELSPPSVRVGEIFRISPIHICYFADPVTRESFCCTFDKLKGYRGQQPVDFGLIPGTAIHFGLDSNGEVEWVELQ